MEEIFIADKHFCDYIDFLIANVSQVPIFMLLTITIFILFMFQSRYSILSKT